MVKIPRIPFFFFIILTVLVVSQGCATMLIRETSSPSLLKTSNGTRGKTKVYMKDGSLYFLDSLITYKNKDTVNGFGWYYNQDRILSEFNIDAHGNIAGPAFRIPVDTMALVEVNTVEGMSGKALAIALVSVPSMVLTIYCIINPKACFGSCPTFYSWDGQDTTLMAEGFSSSILPAYEKEDIDMLYHAKPTGAVFHLKMKNEALETHVISSTDLIAVPVSRNERVFATEEGEFFNTTDIQCPAVCLAPEGDCLDAVLKMDRMERFSLSDPDDLAEKETIYLTFTDVPDGDKGLIIGCRQTLLTTYLFYQSLAYLGSRAGYFAARIESNDKSLKRKVDRVWNLLGGIEIFIADRNGKWKKINELEEMGPLATDVHLIKMPGAGLGNLKVKLRLTKGLWRINYIALGKIPQQLEPITISPFAFVNESSIENNVSGYFSDPIVTLPGDVYDICFRMPDSPEEYEFFLKSRGYYIEWMRDTWIKEESHRNAAIFFGFPRLFMKMAADDFKKTESSMEESFWNSKYVRKD